MTPYRVSAPPPPEPREARERCDVCGLETFRDWPSRSLSIALDTMWIIAHPKLHGPFAECPGPPRVKLVPWWRALLELLV